MADWQMRNQQTPNGVWLVFGAFILLLLFIYPPLLGAVLGIAGTYLIIYMIYRLIGGK